MKKLNIKNRLILLVIICLVPLIILDMVQIKSSYNKNLEREFKYNENLSEAISQSFTNYLEQLWSEELAFGLAIAWRYKENPNEVNEIFERLLDKNGTVLRYSWVNPTGDVIASSTKELVGMSLKKRDYVKRLIKGEEKVISNLELSYLDKHPILPVARRIEVDGKLIGFAVAVVDVNKLHNILPTKNLKQGRKFGLVENNGVIVYRSGDEKITFKKRKIEEDSPVWKAIKGEIVRTNKIVSRFDNKAKVGVAYPIKSIKWGCYVRTSIEELTAFHKKDAIIDVVVLIIVTLVSLFTAMRFSKYITKPIYILKNATKKIIDGDFSVRTNIEGYDEVAVTAQAFDDMAYKLQEYDTLKIQFFSNISHELKTPLNIILSTIQLLELNYTKTDDNCKFIKHNKVMKQNCYRLLRLINNLIDITRFDSGFMKIRLGNYNIIEIIEDITMSVVSYAKSKDIDIVFDTEVEEKIMSCDPDKIERIVLNLLSNAIKFTKNSGSIYVNIYDKGENIIITIEDTGIGIPKNKLNHIFGRFHQVDSSLSRQNEGSGIGLSLAKALVEGHKGKIKVESEEDKGTKFIIELPYNIIKDEEDKKYMNKSKEQQDLIEKIHVEFSDIYDIDILDK